MHLVVAVFAAAAMSLSVDGFGQVKETTKEEKKKKPTAPAQWNFFAHYKQRVEQIERSIAELPADTTATIVLLGDSITEGFPVTEIAGMRVVNMGISGDQIAMDRPDGGVRNRVHLLAKARPAHVFLLIGINDFGSSKPLDKAKSQYEDLVRAIRTAVPNAKLHIQSVLPTRGRFAHHNPTVSAMNDFLRNLSKRENADFIDLAALMRDERGELRKGWTGDGLHLLPPAYEEWKKVLEEKVRANESTRATEGK
jgi:lysophospholipase L1-like esterase